MDSLKKYIPFINFILKIDQQKYIKFINIRKWILQKKNYPLSDLNKIEQSIITQYKNLLLETNLQIPQHITNIFAPMNLKQFVNLCSDDEEEEIERNNKDSSKTHTLENQEETQISSKLQIVDISDDDLEIVSVDDVANTKKKVQEATSTKRNISKSESKDEEIDEASKNILKRIDKFAVADLKNKNSVHEPHIYTYKKTEDIAIKVNKENIYERGTINSEALFKRRTDFIDAESLDNKKDANLCTTLQIGTISLDSSSDSEDENGSVPNAANLSKENVDKNTTSVENKIHENIDLLYNSIESVTLDLNEILDGANTTNNTNQNKNTDFELSVESMCEDKTNNSKTPDLSPQQVSKVLEDLLSRNEFELDTLIEAVALVTQLDFPLKTKMAQNTSGIVAPASSPLPHPPSIANNFSSTTLHHLQPQQQAAMAPPLIPHCHQNSNVVSKTGIEPLRPKINVNDPRIKKELQALQNSPLFKYNVLNKHVEESIKKIWEAQQLQQPQPQQPTQLTVYPNKNNTACTKTTKNTNKSLITYGEYKRRQLEKKLEMERQREEEQKGKDEAQRDRQLEMSKNREAEIRSKLLSTLKPCKELLTTLWNQQKNLASNSTTTKSSKKEQHEESTTATPIFNENKKSYPKVKKRCASAKVTKQSKKKKENSCSQNNNSSDQKRHRIYNELKCTVKGFDQIHDYVPNIADKSIEKSNHLQSHTKNIKGLKRRSSMLALSAISEQLNHQLSDCSDSELNDEKNLKRQIEEMPQNLPSESLSTHSKRRKTIDEEIIRSTKPTNKRRILDDYTSSEQSHSDIEELPKIPKQPVIKLRRLTANFIRQHTRRAKEDKNVETTMGDLSSKLKKTGERPLKSKEGFQKPSKLKKYNNNCQMTERNTSVCVLCRSKPSDLTNHYIYKHKSESYVARLDWTELEELNVSTPFARLLPKSKGQRFERYEAHCPFCKEKIIDQFNNLYNHFSTHTGEYAFQCSHCHFSKPYRPDIQSHILHSKTCRVSSIQVMYRYPPHAQCIYLHCCRICNFVQLNEANVLKHLREHHDPAKAIVSNVQKCILAAMSDGPDTNEAKAILAPPVAEQANGSAAYSTNLVSEEGIAGTTTGIHFKVDDDDVPVGNEPCLEDEFLENPTLEEQLKQMHEETSISNILPPMTVIHSHTAEPSAELNLSSIPAQKHVPKIVKSETMDLEEKVAMPPPTSSTYNVKEEPEVTPPLLPNYIVYNKYRYYPQNVNYLGLFKCMIGDCYYSTDCSDEMLKHLMEHYSAELQASEHLQCPYCIMSTELPISPKQLVEHVRNEHEHLNYQCSICCYRSCDASNVRTHQQEHHSSALSECQIFKCKCDSNGNSKHNVCLEKQVADNVLKISCKLCHLGFYHTQLLIMHLDKEHQVSSVNDLQHYSCIYCQQMSENINHLRVHIALEHPEKQPLIYNHNNQIDINACEDCTDTSNVVSIAESVEWIEVVPSAVAINEENLLEDVKPDAKNLLYINEETVKVRLQKLTAHTGIRPDNLYKCPEQKCGGFFSVFELWLRHMKNRHYTLECQCPHCQTAALLPLEQFSLHFEEHRGHTFVCFHCSTTHPTELLASQHISERHNHLGTIRYEKIEISVNYCYSIMIQSDLFTDRENFIAEFLNILNNRLKELEDNEIKKLQQQWIIEDNNPWIEDFLKNLANRKLARRCLVKNCQFLTLSDKILFRHLSTSHTIQGTQFICSKCDYRIEKCNNLNELFTHIKLHNEYIFICVACSLSTASRSKLSAHIKATHSARDVPIVHLFRNNQEMYIKISIVFSNNHLTFSTMKNCFCCSERNMDGDVFALHLKRYHKLSLTYYCENCINFAFKSLNEVIPHYQQFHKSNDYKIHCELASHSDLSVTALNEFQIQISPLEHNSCLVNIKSEPPENCDADNVILLETDDIVIQNSLRDERLKSIKETPKLKCTSLNKLMKPNSTKSKSLILPTIPSCSAVFQTKSPSINRNFNHMPMASSLPPAAPAFAETVLYHVAPFINNINISEMNSQILHHAAPHADLPYTNTIMPPIQPHLNSSMCIYPPAGHVPEVLNYQNRNMQRNICNDSTNRPFFIVQNYNRSPYQNIQNHQS